MTQGNVAIDVVSLVRSAQAIVEALPALDLGEEEKAALSEVAYQLIAEAERDNPDEARLGTLGHQMVVPLERVITGAKGGTLAGVLLDRLRDAMGG